MEMREFGSDFHYIKSFTSHRAHLTDVFRNAILLADGRQCIVALIRQYKWRRLWMPDYFCYEVIDTIKRQTGIEVLMYEDSPLKEGNIEILPFKEGDVLLRMNFFGLRCFRSNKNIRIPVIEDHSHDLLGNWALYSDADWCIASIRKTLPMPEGGMMWSPKGHVCDPFSENLEVISEKYSTSHDEFAAMRWSGMEIKTAYLQGEDMNKEEFRKIFTETEEWFDHAEPSRIDKRSEWFVTEQLDINLWLGAKKRNWTLLNNLVNKEHCEVITAEHESCTMFSLVLLIENRTLRDIVRKRLIDSCVYPAVLWNLPETASDTSKDFSQRMLSVHCDGRYTEKDIVKLSQVLNNTFNTIA